MKTSALALAAACLFLACAADAQGVAGRGFLHAQNKQIVDGNGQPVLLRGMGLGGWMLQEGYMLSLDKLGTQRNIRAKISGLIGPDKTAAFYQAWRDNDITKADVDAMAGWGFNSIRLPMHYNLFLEDTPGKIVWKPEGFAMVDRLIRWAKDNDMVVILDLHAAPGGQGNNIPISDRDPAAPSLWDSPDDQAKMIALWAELARRYKDEPTVGGYDLLNEPNWGFQKVTGNTNGCAETDNGPLRDLLVRTTAAIRAVDQNHLIIIEGNCWGGNYAGMFPAGEKLWDSNIAISFHKYWDPTTQETIAPYLKLRDDLDVPLWNGESGENSNDWFARAIQLEENNGIGWSWWPLKKIGFNNPLEIIPNRGYAAVADYLNGDGPKPSADEATQALMQLAAHDIRFENNAFHKDVVDAIFRTSHSEAAVPFAENKVDATATILAVDYDMGRNGVAYFDTTPSNEGGNPTLSPGNDGGTYRNDGVDIDRMKDGQPFVSQMRTGEWLHYTLNVTQAGTYDLSLTPASEALTIQINNGPEIHDFNGLTLDAGRNVLVIKAVNGPADLIYFTLTRRK